MQMCPLHMLREGKASKHAKSKLLNFYPFHLVFTCFFLRNTVGLYFVVTGRNGIEVVGLEVACGTEVAGVKVDVVSVRRV